MLSFFKGFFQNNFPNINIGEVSNRVVDNGFEYINPEHWTHTFIDGEIVPFPIEIKKFSGTKKIKTTPVESGNNSINEWYGRYPYNFTIKFTIGANNRLDFIYRKNFLMKLHTDINKKLNIVNPVLLEYGIRAIIVTGFSVDEEISDSNEGIFQIVGELYCREYSENIFQYTELTEDQQMSEYINYNIDEYNENALSELADMLN